MKIPPVALQTWLASGHGVFMWHGLACPPEGFQ